MQFFRVILLLVFIIASCEKDEVLTNDNVAQPFAHKFLIVENSGRYIDSTVYSFDSQGKLREAVYFNRYNDINSYRVEYSYSDSSVFYTKYDNNGLQVGIFTGFLNSQGYFYKTIWQGEQKNFRYDNDGYLISDGEFSFSYENGNLVNAINYGCTNVFISYEYYPDLTFLVYPVIIHLANDVAVPYQISDHFDFSFMGSPYYGKQNKNLVKRCYVYVDHITSPLTETYNTAYSYQLDERGYVTSERIDNDIITFNYH